jgi:hypothetical protein
MNIFSSDYIRTKVRNTSADGEGRDERGCFSEIAVAMLIEQEDVLFLGRRFLFLLLLVGPCAASYSFQSIALIRICFYLIVWRAAVWRGGESQMKAEIG